VTSRSRPDIAATTREPTGSTASGVRASDEAYQQVYRLFGIGAALPLIPAAAGLLILVAVAVRTGQAGSRLPGPAGPGCLVRPAARVLCPR
jgi:hypothetical protein